jgi:hypothetical protein
MCEELQPVFRFREMHRVEVACNEFGVFVGGADRDSQLNWMRDFVAVLGEHEIGLSYWNYKNLDFGIISQGEGAFAAYARYQNPDRTDADLVRILRGKS